MISNPGASRCHPIGAPGGYSVTSTSANSCGCRAANSPIRCRNCARNSGIGGAGVSAAGFVFVAAAEMNHAPLRDDVTHLYFRKGKLLDCPNECLLLV